MHTCTPGALLVHSWCNPGALLVWSWSTPGGLLVRSWCTLGAFLVHSKCHSVRILLEADTGPFRCWKHDIFLSSRHGTRSAPGWHQGCTRIAPGVHQEYQRSAPGVRQECTRRLMTHLLSDASDDTYSRFYMTWPVLKPVFWRSQKSWSEKIMIFRIKIFGSFRISNKKNSNFSS